MKYISYIALSGAHEAILFSDALIHYQVLKAVMSSDPLAELIGAGQYDGNNTVGWSESLNKGPHEDDLLAIKGLLGTLSEQELIVVCNKRLDRLA